LCVCLPVFALFGCADEFSQAKKMEKIQRYASAIEQYENFAAKNPGHKRAPEALLEIGRIYQTILNDYPRARSYYKKVIESYKGSKFAPEAEMRFMNSPDYFPLKSGLVIVMGDSSSGGDYMRSEERISALKKDPSRFKFSKKLFAGDREISDDERLYEKKDLKLKEYSLPNFEQTIALVYPPETNTSWETEKDGKKLYYTIELDSVAVSVMAGDFTRCLKVREYAGGSRASWKTFYFAPDAGLILSCVSTINKETRILELLRIETGKGTEKGKGTAKAEENKKEKNNR